MVPNVKPMDSQREPKACDAVLQAVGQRTQLIPEVLANDPMFANVSRRTICVELAMRQGRSC